MIIDFTSPLIWILFVSAAAVISLGFTAFVRWTRSSPAVPEHKLFRLYPGLTMEEVEQLLGPPRLKGWSASKLPQWTYGPAIKDYVLLIEFDENLRVANFLHWSRSEPLPSFHDGTAAL